MSIGVPDPLEAVPEDPRIAPIRAFVASDRNPCVYGARTEAAGKIQYSVAPDDLNVDVLGAEVDRFYAGHMASLVVLAPAGFSIRTGEKDRATDMARRMNRALWLAFARRATAEQRAAQPEAWTDAYYESLWDREQHAADMAGRAVQPCDHESSYNIQAMGPWYKNEGHYRWAPGDLFLLLTSMKAIHRLQQAVAERATIAGIRQTAYASTDGLVDFQALVVPEDLDDLHPLQRQIVTFQRQMAARFGRLPDAQ